jgi:hypothetical protein
MDGVECLVALNPHIFFVVVKVFADRWEALRISPISTVLLRERLGRSPANRARRRGR